MQAQLGQHPEGLLVDLFDRSLTRKIASGRLASVDNQIDTATGTVRLRAQFDNPDATLFPNQFVNARLEGNALQNARLVSSAAIQYNGQQAFVYVTRPDGTVKVQNVTVVASDQKDAALDGIDPGATVVSSNFDRLTDGAKVTVVAAQDRPDGGAPPPIKGPAQ